MLLQKRFQYITTKKIQRTYHKLGVPNEYQTAVVWPYEQMRRVINTQHVFSDELEPMSQ